MTARSIPFRAPMIRALLDGSKTQTRRVAKPRGYPSLLDGSWSDSYVLDPGNRDWLMRDCPYGQPGDLIVVKEATYLWCERRPNGLTPTGRQKWHYVPMREAPVHYAADGRKPTTSIVSPDTGNLWMWRSKVARFMPRWASRLTLRITDVRVERLQDISEDDARNEGVSNAESFRGIGVDEAMANRYAYRELWQTINGPGSWDANPWVWARTFDVIPRNANDVLLELANAEVTP